jgi:hypothetical protein
VIALKKKPEATKCSEHYSVRHIAHTAKIGVRLLRKWVERKIEDVLGEEKFGFRRGKGSRDVILAL